MTDQPAFAHRQGPTMVAIGAICLLFVVAAAMGSDDVLGSADADSSPGIASALDVEPPTWLGLGGVPVGLPSPASESARLAAMTPLQAMPVVFLRPASPIIAGQAAPHGYRGPCPQCHRVLPGPGARQGSTPARPVAVPSHRQLPPTSGGPYATAGGWVEPGAHAQLARSGAPDAAPMASHAPTALPVRMGGRLPWQEAHWQGIEVVPLTGALARVLNISPESKGVLIDDVTWPADMAGFRAADLITSVGSQPTHTLEQFVDAADAVRDRGQVEVALLRKGELTRLPLVAGGERLGTAVGETAPMIPSGAKAPHDYLGPCTNCHRIGTSGQMAVDPGDPISKSAPPIRRGQPPPHRDRGECSVCHVIQ